MQTALSACSSDGSGGSQNTSSGSTNEDVDAATPVVVDDPSRPRLPAPIRPDASCDVVIETPPLLASPHVPEGTVVDYNSNPPSSGPHYPIWANFGEYPAPVQAGYLVHDLEHGAVLLLYKPCDDDAGANAADALDGGDVDASAASTCASIKDALRRVRDAIHTDPVCDPSIRVRVIIAPYPDLDVPIAAAAWGWTYRANCLDEDSLRDFAVAHYGQGPENICAPGQMF